MTRKTENSVKTASAPAPKPKPKPKPRARRKRRKAGGRDFVKGAPSPNPKGRPKKDFDLVTRCRELTPKIIEHYAVMGAGAITAAEVMAGKVVIEYGNDKPRQRTELSGPNGAPLNGPTVLLVLPDDESGPDEPSGDPGAD